MTKQDLRIVFFGTPEFAVASLKRLVDGGYNIVAAVTMPDKQAGRGRHIMQSDVKKYAEKSGIPLLQPEKLKDGTFIDALRSFNADLFIVIAFRMLPEIVWGMPPLGTFNLHASLLPKYRGAAPINWAVINGETETGVTTFFLQHEIDTGDIIQQKHVEIGITDNVGIVHDKLMELGADMVVETVDNLINGTVKPIPQDRLTAGMPVIPAPKIFKDTCHINWNRPAMTVYNHIRGLSPYPAAWNRFDKDGKEFQLKIYETGLPETNVATGQTPGTVSVRKDKVFVACSDGELELLSIQLSGKKRMGIPEFLRGFNLEKTMLE